MKNILDKIKALYARVVSLKRFSFLLVLLLLLAALALVVAAVVAASSALLSLPLRFWQLLGLCLLALVVLWWFASGARRFSHQGFARKRLGDLGPGDPAEEQDALARMRVGITQAKQAIQRSPSIEKGRDPLYRIPWLLFLGDREANVAGTLREANKISPFPAPGEDEQAFWRWWFFKSMIAIETPAAIVCDPAARRERGLWYQALMLLATERDKLPLNGIVVCMAARTLLYGPETVKAETIRLRRLVDEALEHLQVQLPVYLLVTGLEQLPGYATFAAALPEAALAQALGYRLPESEIVSAATAAQLDEIFSPIVERLHALRITALRAQHTPAERRAVFEVVEQVRKLHGGLLTLVEVMLENNPFQRTPRWRGLYLSGAPDSGAKAGAFLSDLFSRFLPIDQPLATPSRKGNAGRFTVAAVGILAMLGLSSLLSLSFFNAHADDGKLLIQTRVACQEPNDAGVGRRIGWLARCGRTIEELEVASENASLSFGLRQADSDIEQLKNLVVKEFSSLV
ncbi:MAG: hypothetical protein LBF16_03580, partial [Pseudomonadales bacterium]|nr:hypothetical protein [Pseudomonadales bacterium]